MDRSLGLIVTILLTFFLLIVRPGCNLDIPPPVKVSEYYPPVDSNPSAAGGINQQVSTSTTPSTIIVGSFNIQAFGPSKASKPFVMDKLVDIVRRYDLLAIQELRNKDQSVIEEFVHQINSDGSRYSYIIGLRQGYTHSKEQYVFLFDTAKFRLTSNPYIARDSTNSMHRTPLVASFECTQAPAGQGFTFTALNLHTDPDVAIEEFRALESIMPDIRSNHPNEDDFIVIGDFNGSANEINKFRLVQNQLALIRSTWPTTIRSRRSIDNIIIDGLHTSEYYNQAGVLDIELQYNLDKQQALQISDHYPVWSVFSTVEAKNRLAENDALLSR